MNTTTQKLHIIFWNVWFEVQNGKRGDGVELCRRLQELIDTHSPDVFGLNEVYQRNESENSKVADVLKANGYQVHFAPLVHSHSGELIGSLFATKLADCDVKDYNFGEGVTPNIKWYLRYFPLVINAQLMINGKLITIVVAHLCVLHPRDWLTHIKHRRSFNAYIRSLPQDNLIIGGDFNETKYMPPWLHLPKHLRRLTGSFKNPTWRPNGWRHSPLRGNLDHLVYSTSGNLALKHFEVLDATPSDHAPLLALFEIRQ